MVTVLEASKCPKCKAQGQLYPPEKGANTKGKAVRRFLEGEWWDVTTYYCHNPDCNWYNTGWLVSSNARGEVFERDQGPRGQDKTFQPLTKGALAAGRAQVEEVLGHDAEETKELPPQG